VAGTPQQGLSGRAEVAVAPGVPEVAARPLAPPPPVPPRRWPHVLPWPASWRARWLNWARWPDRLNWARWLN
jgi:hypothetical protein